MHKSRNKIMLIAFIWLIIASIMGFINEDLQNSIENSLIADMIDFITFIPFIVFIYYIIRFYISFLPSKLKK